MLVEPAPYHGLGLHDRVDIIDELETVFGHEVDLVSKRGLRNPFRPHAMLSMRAVIPVA